MKISQIKPNPDNPRTYKDDMLQLYYGKRC
jgi:hypothetical protein